MLQLQTMKVNSKKSYPSGLYERLNNLGRHDTRYCKQYVRPNECMQTYGVVGKSGKDKYVFMIREVLKIEV